MASPAQTQWQALLGALLADREALVADIHAAIRDELPSYRGVSEDSLLASINQELELILSTASAGREAASRDELLGLTSVGEARAREGVAIDEMLLAWRLGVQAVTDQCRERGLALGIPAEELLELVDALSAWSDRAMAVVATGHRGAELALARDEQDSRAQLVTGLLQGSLAPARVRALADAHSLDTEREYIAVRAALAEDEPRSAVERALGFHETTLPRVGLSAVVDGDLAGFLRTPPRADPAFAAGVGPARPLERLAESFALATRALRTAQAFGLAGVHELDALGLLPAVLADDAVGEGLRRRYLDPVGSEIATSVRTYLESEMHVERAAERLFVHPNTLRYRIGRFEELTDASLRDPRTAFEVWWALQRAAIDL